MSDAFLVERDAHYVRDAGVACDARLRRVQERIASLITAQLHHLSLISKLEIALKEASETGYWLELLYRTKYIDDQTFKRLSCPYLHYF